MSAARLSESRREALRHVAAREVIVQLGGSRVWYLSGPHYVAQPPAQYEWLLAQNLIEVAPAVAMKSTADVVITEAGRAALTESLPNGATVNDLMAIRGRRDARTKAHLYSGNRVDRWSFGVCTMGVWDAEVVPWESTAPEDRCKRCAKRAEAR